MTVSEVKARLQRAVSGANRQHGAANADPRLLAAIEALPDENLLKRLAPEMRLPIEAALAGCVDRAK